jgi:hypothetical protein
LCPVKAISQLKINTNLKMRNLKTLLLIVLAVASMASCRSSRKKNSNTGQVVVVKDSRSARADGHTKGLPKGWTKNTNNPHHPNTTNPGHTKHKQGRSGNTVIVVNNSAPGKVNTVKGKPGKGGHDKGNPGKGDQGKGGNGKGGNGKGKGN